MEEKYRINRRCCGYTSNRIKKYAKLPLLTACAKTGKPIMLKRHYGASLRDWLGAAEYILYEGNEN